MNKQLFSMIILMFLISILLISLICLVRADNSIQMQWSKTFSGSDGCAVQTVDGGYVIAGSNASLKFYSGLQAAPVLIKTNSSGDL